MGTRKRTIWLLAVIAGVVIGIVAILFAARDSQSPSELSAASETKEWEPGDVPEPEQQQPPPKTEDDVRWKSGVLAVAAGSGFEGDAGFAFLGALTHDGGAPESALMPGGADPIALAFDAGTNPFAMLAGATKSWSTLSGTVTVDDPPLPPLIDHWSVDPKCVLRPGTRQNSLSVNGELLANAVVIAERIPTEEEKENARKYRQRLPGNYARASEDKPSTATTSISECQLTRRVLLVNPPAQLDVMVKDLTKFTLELRDSSSVLWSTDVDSSSRAKTPPISKEGVFRIADPTHPWLGGLVVSTSWNATVTDARGRYELQLRSGNYRLHVIHELLGETVRYITLTGDATHDFVLKPDEEKLTAKTP